MSDYIQLAAKTGNHNSKNDYMYMNDFYTLCQKNIQNNIGLRKKSAHYFNEVVFYSKDTTLDYLCSDFVRFCLSIYKNNQCINTEEMSLIPKQPFPISDELKDYIESYLPDYYGIR